MILRGTRVTDHDKQAAAFYTAFNRFGTQPDPARLSAALAASSLEASLELLTEPPTQLPSHYAEYLEANRDTRRMIEATLEVAASTGDPFQLAVANDGPILQVSIDESGILFTLRRLPLESV
jgi:hypothetical protein